jgi:hypothetical protein
MSIISCQATVSWNSRANEFHDMRAERGEPRCYLPTPTHTARKSAEEMVHMAGLRTQNRSVAFDPPPGTRYETS